MSKPISPKSTALLNIDMQARFVQGTPGGLFVLDSVNRLIKRFRVAGIKLIHTRHIFSRAEMNALALSQLHANLSVEPSDLVIEKRHLDAFNNTDLEVSLRSHKIDTVIICGLRTNACCQMSAYEAAVRGFRVVFVSDCTAAKGLGGVSAADHHRAACATIDGLIGEVVTADEMMKRLTP